MSMYNGQNQGYFGGGESYDLEQNRLGQLHQNQNNLWSNYTQPQYQPPQIPSQGLGNSSPPPAAPPQQYAPPQAPSGVGSSGLSSVVSNPLQGKTQPIMPTMNYDPKPFNSLTGQASYDYYDKIIKQNPYVQAPTGYGDYMTQKTGTPWVNPNPDTMDFSNSYYDYFDKIQAANPNAGYVVPRGYATWKSQQP